MRMKPAPGELGKVVAMATLFGLLAYAGIELTRGGGRVAMLWLPNAIVAAWLLRSKTQALPLYILACFIANVATNRVVDDAWITAIGLSLANAVEVSVVVWLMRKTTGTHPDLTEIDSHVWLLASALAG